MGCVTGGQSVSAWVDHKHNPKLLKLCTCSSHLKKFRPNEGVMRHEVVTIHGNECVRAGRGLLGLGKVAGGPMFRKFRSCE